MEMQDTLDRKIRLRRRFLVILLLMGCSLGLLTAEIGLRLLAISYRPAVSYIPDPYCGARLKPSSRGVQQKEGRAFIKINSHGMRDVEHSHAKPDGTFRIAVLGDSYAEAAQVDLHETFWSVMQQELQSCMPGGFQKIEVLNFGVAGYGTAQELQMLRHYVWPFEPDMILLAFFPGNDIRNNSRDLEPDQGRPFFFLEEGQLVLDDSFLQDPVRKRFQESSWIKTKDWLIRHSELIAFYHYARHLRHRSQEEARNQEVERGLSDAIYHPPQNEVWQAAWDVTGKLIAQMHREVQERQIPFVVVSVTSPIVVNPEEEPRRQLCARLGVQDLLYPDRWIARLAEEQGFPLVLLSESMQIEAVDSGVYYHGFPNTRLGSGHWNAAGHEFAGKKIAETICREFGFLEK